MSLLAAGAAGAYLCSEAFVPTVGVARAQAGNHGVAMPKRQVDGVIDGQLVVDA